MCTKTKKILICISIIILLASLSCGVYFLLDWLDITNIKTLREFISKFGAWSWVVYILAQVIISTPIFVMPFEDELWVTLAILLFGAKIGCLLSIISMLIISSLLYLIGNKLGGKIAKRLVGEQELLNIQQKLSVKGKLSLPFLYFTPFFPHDSLCVVAGLTKMNFGYFLLVTALIRPLEIIAICFLGGELIKWSNLSAFEWVVFANLIIIDIYLMKKLANLMEKRLEKNKSNLIDDETKEK